jgi:hypothetical protein
MGAADDRRTERIVGVDSYAREQCFAICEALVE